MSSSAELVENVDDGRLAIYRPRRTRDNKAYQKQVWEIAGEAVRSAQPPVDADVEVAPPRLLGGCVVDVHYSWDCMERLKTASDAGRLRASLHSAIVPEGTSDEHLAMAEGLFTSVFVLPKQVFATEFHQDVPWESEGTNHRRAGGASQTVCCRFAVACPISLPLPSLKPPFLVLDGLSSGANVGQILRTAFHLGVNSVIASRETWNCLNGRASRVSMGWLYWMDFHLAEASLAKTLEKLRATGVRIYAAENQFSEPVSPHMPAGDRHWALIVGAEGAGISDAAIAASDVRIAVPQQQGVCMNVAHATSICLYELGRHSFQET